MAASSPQRLSVAVNEAASSPPPQGVAAFITKVWKILENQDYQHLVSWSECGKNVIVHDYPNFSKDILPRYFKHNNFNSFVRQLNLYGFRKVSHPDQGVLSKVQESEPIEFWHPNFRQGHPELLYLVQRRPVASRFSSEEKAPQLNKVLTDIHQMKGKQENIGGMLDAMGQDNAHLKRELELLKEKHIRQQRVLNKIIQFLVHMVYKGRLPTSNRRRPGSNYLMLTGPDDMAPAPKRGRVSLPSPDTPFTFPDPPFSDLSSLPIEPVPTLEPIGSVPPSSLTEFTVTSPPSSPSQHMTSLDSTTAHHLLESFQSSTCTSTSPVPPSTFTHPSTESSNTLPTTITHPTIPTSSPLSSSPTSSLFPVLPVIPDPATQPTFDIINDFSADPSYTWSHLTGHLDSYQQELDSLPNFLSNQLSVDSSIINQFVNLGSQPVPDYDATDTARLLETLSGEEGGGEPAALHESSTTAIVPISHSQLPTLPLLPSSLSPLPLSLDKDEPSSSLRELLELKDALSEP